MKGTILIVDDRSGAREALKGILGPIYSVLTAEEANAAIKCIQIIDVDVVILSLQLPGSVLDLLREIKKIIPDIEVIVTAGYGYLGLAQEAIRFGAGDFITTPYNTADITTIAKKAFERKEYNQKLRELLQQIKDLRKILKERSEPSAK